MTFNYSIVGRVTLSVVLGYSLNICAADSLAEEHKKVLENAIRTAVFAKSYMSQQCARQHEALEAAYQQERVQLQEDTRQKLYETAERLFADNKDVVKSGDFQAVHNASAQKNEQKIVDTKKFRTKLNHAVKHAVEPIEQSIARYTRALKELGYSDKEVEELVAEFEREANEKHNPRS